MSEDWRPGEDHGQDELIAAFAALGGRLTGDEFMRLLGSAEYYGSVVRLAGLLLAGDTAAADTVARDSLAALQQTWSRLGDPEKARVYLYQTVLNRARSVRRDRVIGERETPQAAPDALGAGHAAADDLGREPWVGALRALPGCQREAVVLHYYLGLSGQQAAQVMCISAEAARSHLARACHCFGARLGRNDPSRSSAPWNSPAGRRMPRKSVVRPSPVRHRESPLAQCPQSQLPQESPSTHLRQKRTFAQARPPGSFLMAHYASEPAGYSEVAIQTSRTYPQGLRASSEKDPINQDGYSTTKFSPNERQ